jgi:hypothetical protein
MTREGVAMGSLGGFLIASQRKKDNLVRLFHFLSS